MTPESAASILGVATAATREQVESAYRQRSRASHPDRFVGAGQAKLASASAEFVRVTQARETLLSVMTRPDGTRAEVPPPYEGYEVRQRFAPSWAAFAAWTLLLMGAIVISAFDDAPPLGAFDVVLRLIPLGVSAVAFALTGLRWWFIALLFFTAASVAVTIATASFGPLLSLEILLVPLLGLAAQGRKRAKQRTRVSPESS